MGVPARAARILAAGVLALVGLSLTPLPAQAATTPPWRWELITGSLYIPSVSTADTYLQCDAGYTPISGGFDGLSTNVRRMLEYPNPGINGFSWQLHNSGGSPVSVPLTLWCASADAVGETYTTGTSFARNGSGRAAGTAACPDGWSVLSGSADWSNYVEGKTIDYSGPRILGDGWYATGYSPTSGAELYVEVRCIPDSSLPDVTPVVNPYDTTTVVGGVQHRTANCPAGKRVLDGGSWARQVNTNAFDTTGVGRGTTYESHIVTNGLIQGWQSSANVSGQSTFDAIARCIPASIPTAVLTSKPSNPSLANSGTWTFSASDPAGEPLSLKCSFDGSFVSPCNPGEPIPWGPVGDGTHRMQIHVTNEEGQIATDIYDFSVDATAPKVQTRTPISVITVQGTVKADFSEPVYGVDASTFQVFEDGSATPLAGTLTAYPPPNANTSATFKPKDPLVPGQKYAVKLSSSIHDGVGHALVVPTWNLRVTGNVDNGNVAFKEYWDPDTSGVASGGGVISSYIVGNEASLAFSAPASGSTTLHVLKQPNGGYAEVYLDGVKKTTASTYAASTTRTALYTVDGLAPGSAHTLRVRVLGTREAGSAGNWVAVDSVTVGTSVKQETAMVQRFRRFTDAASYAGTYDSVQRVTGGDTGGAPSYFLRFRGTGISVHATKTTTSGQAKVYVDGVLVGTVSLASSGTVSDTEVFAKALTDGVHTIRVIPVGTSNGANSAVNLDRFVVQ